MELYTEMFLTYFRRLEATRKSIEDILDILDEVLDSKLTMKQYLVLHALCNCKTFAETAEFLSEIEGKPIRANSVERLGRRALKAFKRHLDEILKKLAKKL